MRLEKDDFGDKQKHTSSVLMSKQKETVRLRPNNQYTNSAVESYTRAMYHK